MFFLIQIRIIIACFRFYKVNEDTNLGEFHNMRKIIIIDDEFEVESGEWTWMEIDAKKGDVIEILARQ